MLNPRHQRLPARHHILLQTLRVSSGVDVTDYVAKPAHMYAANPVSETETTARSTRTIGFYRENLLILIAIDENTSTANTVDATARTTC